MQGLGITQKIIITVIITIITTTTIARTERTEDEQKYEFDQKYEDEQKYEFDRKYEEDEEQNDEYGQKYYDTFEENDDELGIALNRLYQEQPDEIMDPHDMLTRPGERKRVPQPNLDGDGAESWGSDIEGEEEEVEEEEKMEEEKEEGLQESYNEGSQNDNDMAEGKNEKKKNKHRGARELNECVSQLNAIQSKLDDEQIASLKLQKRLAKEGILELEGFYRRAVQHLWNALRLGDDAVKTLLKGAGNNALLRRVIVHVTSDDLEGMANYLEKETDPHKVDEFLERGFVLADGNDAYPTDPSAIRSLFHSLSSLLHSTLQAGKNLEVWLVALCSGFVCLGGWAVVLFIRDVQRELRWGRVLTMMVVVVFFICCLWHWRHMYKLAESRRHAQLAKRGYAGIPEECHPDAQPSTTAGSVFQWVKITVFGSPDVCERYFEELMIDAMEEITPGMVIAETLSRFIFQPLQHFGTEAGKLTTNFYKNVPLAYHLHATALLLGLLTLVLFYGCAYGIDFPFGLGGFRPMSRPAVAAPERDEDAIGRKALEQLKRDREKFLEESRKMLSDITTVAVGWQGQRQPLVAASSSILEGQLERLITQHIARAMNHNHHDHDHDHHHQHNTHGQSYNQPPSTSSSSSSSSYMGTMATSTPLVRTAISQGYNINNTGPADNTSSTTNTTTNNYNQVLDMAMDTAGKGRGRQLEGGGGGGGGEGHSGRDVSADVSLGDISSSSSASISSLEASRTSDRKTCSTTANDIDRTENKEGRSPLIPQSESHAYTNFSFSLSQSEAYASNLSKFEAHSKALLVSTDAVHRRVADKSPVKVLPPRSSSANSSRSSSTTSSPASSAVNSPASRRHKATKVMRLFRSTESEDTDIVNASPTSKTNPNHAASTHSLGAVAACSLDEPDLGVAGPTRADSSSFLAEVRNILDLSSGASEPGTPLSGTSSGRAGRRDM